MNIDTPEVQSQERTEDAPQQGKPQDPQNSAQLTPDEQKKLINLVRKYRQGWQLRRRMLIKRVLKAHEFFKGNQNISFDPESFSFTDSFEEAFSAAETKDDIQLYEFVNNVYQMLAIGFVAALSTQAPKSRFMPENAEKEADLATAKTASTLMEIVERKNKIKSLQRQGLLYLWMAGCYFRHTRYIVDGDLAGTHEEPVPAMVEGELLPDRYVCPQCGATVPESQIPFMQALKCPQCGYALGSQDFYPAEHGEMPVISGYEDVPNGMVRITLYSPMNVDADPEAKTLLETPILNVDQEVHLASLRTQYPSMWDQLQASGSGPQSEGTNERLMRQQVYSDSTGRSQASPNERPTLSRTWIQPFAFNALDDKVLANKLSTQYPTGLLLVNVNDTFLEAREAKLSDEWSWCGTVEETFGLFPPAVGDAVIPFNERINDVANLTHEHMDRLSGGIIIANEDIISTNSLNGKALMPGIINGVKLKKGGAGQRLEDAFFQAKFTQDANIYEYEQRLLYAAQLISGVTPQVFGGAGDPNIQTKGGQEQQLNTALGKLSFYWEHVRDEFALGAEIAVKCAAKNITDDMFDVVTDETKEYRNKYVRLDDMQGNVHAYPETDQGFPMSYPEMRDRWMQLVEAAAENPLIAELFEDPTNQQQAAIFIGVPGLVIPGKAMRSRVLKTIDKLLDGKPIPTTQQTPMGDVPVTLPSEMPDKDFDDFGVIEKVVREWAHEHDDVVDENPEGFANVKAYYQLALEYAKQKAAASQPPPNPNPQQGAPQQ